MRVARLLCVTCAVFLPGVFTAMLAVLLPRRAHQEAVLLYVCTQVGPVFAIHGMPVTPVEGEHYAGPGNNITRTELSALFAVIGTPSWRCIEGVDNPAWRRYLRKMPPR
jgi:hypothetical protein